MLSRRVCWCSAASDLIGTRVAIRWVKRREQHVWYEGTITRHGLMQKPGQAVAQPVHWVSYDDGEKRAYNLKARRVVFLTGLPLPSVSRPADVVESHTPYHPPAPPPTSTLPLPPPVPAAAAPSPSPAPAPSPAFHTFDAPGLTPHADHAVTASATATTAAAPHVPPRSRNVFASRAVEDATGSGDGDSGDGAGVGAAGFGAVSGGRSRWIGHAGYGGGGGGGGGGEAGSRGLGATQVSLSEERREDVGGSRSGSPRPSSVQPVGWLCCVVCCMSAAACALVQALGS